MSSCQYQEGDDQSQSPCMQNAQNAQNQCSTSSTYQQNNQNMQDQYNQFFGNLINQVRQFKIEDIPPQELQRHRIRIIDQNDLLWKKMINQGAIYAQNSNSRFGGLECSYDVVIGRFYLLIDVLNLHRNSGQGFESQNQKSNDLGEGAFGVVKQADVGYAKIAVKRLLLTQKNKKNNLLPNILDPSDKCTPSLLRRAIKQYCIYKICSMLKIGPQVIFNSVYDLVCYNDSIQFQMQLCQKIQNIVLPTYERDLKQCVAMLHAIKFVHKDIKPTNTLYSPSLKKYILSDFGLAHSVKQTLKQKTETYFEGTPTYVCQDMKNLLQNNQPGQINLYLNDIHALKITLSQFKQIQQINQFSQNPMSQIENASQYNCESNYQNQYQSNIMSANTSNKIQNSQNNYQISEQQPNLKKKDELKLGTNNCSINQEFLKEISEVQESNLQEQSGCGTQTSNTDSYIDYQTILAKYSVEINFYQMKTVYQLLRQFRLKCYSEQSNKKSKATFFQYFSQSNPQKYQNARKNQQQFNKLIKEAVQKICTFESRQQIKQNVLIFVKNLFQPPKDDYHKTIIVIRNTVRTFGLYSQQVVAILQKLMQKQQIPFVNYNNLKRTIQLIQKYKDVYNQKRYQVQCLDFNRHHRLQNTKAIVKEMKYILRNNRIDKNMDFNKKKSIIKGFFCLMAELTIGQVYLLKMKRILLYLLDDQNNSMKGQIEKVDHQLNQLNVKIKKKSTRKQNNKTIYSNYLTFNNKFNFKSKYDNNFLEYSYRQQFKTRALQIKLKSDIIRLIVRVLDQCPEQTLDFQNYIYKAYEAIGAQILGEVEQLPKLKQKFEQTFNKYFKKNQNNIYEQVVMLNQQEQYKYNLLLYLILQGLFRCKYYMDAYQVAKVHVNYVKNNKDYSLKAIILQQLIIIFMKLRDFKLAQQLNQQCLKLRKSQVNQRVNSPELTLCYHYKGILFAQQKNYQKAIQYLNLTKDIIADSVSGCKYKRYMLVTLENLAVCYDRLGNYKESEKYIQETLNYSYLYEWSRLEDQTRYVDNVIREKLKQNSTEGLYECFDELLYMKAEFIDSAFEPTQKLYRNLKRLPAFLFDPIDEDKTGLYKEQVIIFAKKTLLFRLQQYLPYFLVTYRQLCQVIGKYYQQKKMTSKALPYYSLYFSRYCFADQLQSQFYKRIEAFTNILMSTQSNRRALKFLKQFVFKIPGMLTKTRIELFKKLYMLTRDLGQKVGWLYGLMYKNRAFQSMENYEKCVDVVNTCQNKQMRSMYLKKLKTITVLIVPQQQIKFQKERQQKFQISIVKHKQQQKIDQQLQKKISTHGCYTRGKAQFCPQYNQQYYKVFLDKLNEQCEIKAEAIIEEKDEGKYGVEEFKDLIKKKRKERLDRQKQQANVNGL